jgi:hypothetical protein
MQNGFAVRVKIRKALQKLACWKLNARSAPAADCGRVPGKQEVTVAGAQLPCSRQRGNNSLSLLAGIRESLAVSTSD